MLLREKPAEVETSTWDIAQGMKAHIRPGEQDQDSPGK